MLSRSTLRFLAGTVLVVWACAGWGQQPPTADRAPARPQQAEVSKENARKAKEALAEGKRAEAAAQWEAALAHYEDAVALSPQREYVERREFARFRAVQQHVDCAEQAAVAGRLEEARAQLHLALRFDPTYEVARERLRQFAALAQRGPRLVATDDAAPVRLQPQAGARSFNFSGDTRGAYEELARQFGLTATFDDALQAKQVRFRVEDVDFATAIHILTLQTHTFWVALDAKVFLVAEDSVQKRREFQPLVVRTILLPGSSTPDQMTETQRVVREVLGISRVTLNLASRTLTIRDTPQNVALAFELVREFEQARGEILLEINILEVDRQRARQLGILPPTSAQVFTISPQDLEALQNPQASPEALAQLLRRIFGSALGTGTGQVGLGGLIPPLVAFGGGDTVLLATLPGAAAQFAETLSVVRKAQRILLRSQDREEATFFVGERFPINLAVLSASLGVGVAAVAPRVEFPAGAQPRDIVALDFNQDGFTDVVVTNPPANTVSVLLGNGDGTLGDPTAFPVGNAPFGLGAGDFNGDSDADLAVVNSNDNNVSILLGNGDGTFGLPVNFPTGVLPAAVIAADLNGDTLLDLAVTNQSANTVSILLGNGDGTFQSATDFPTGAGPLALTAADLNADTFLDLTVANQTANTVSILLGVGDGTFGVNTDFVVGNAPSGVVAVDFDGDALLDLAVTNANDNTVSILIGNGDGTFSTRTDFSTGTSPFDLLTFDVDADGNRDLVIVNQGDDTLSVLFGNGDGTFGLRADFATGDGPSALASGDFNGDGRTDAAAANLNADSVTIVLNTAFLVPPGAGLQPQPYPGFQYEDLGVKVRARPRMHARNEVTLQLQIELRSRTGEALNGIPVISNRTVEHTVRVREDHTSVVTGMILHDDSRGIRGWRGAATPGVGYLAGTRDTQAREAELIITVTPRRIRLAPRTGRSLYIGRDPAGATPAARPPQ
jgi:Flp pilus assembly secretin CpaC